MLKLDWRNLVHGIKLLAIGTAVFVAATAAVQAQSFPQQPVKIIVPYSAGGNADLTTRLLAEELQKIWGQPVVVENQPGGGTIVGTVAAAGAAADGYTLLMAAAPFTTNPAVRSNLPYDTFNDFEGITIFNGAAVTLTAHRDFAPNTLAEVIAAAKARPVDRPLTYATAGVGGSPQMFASLISMETGATFQQVPYTGAAELMPDVIAGRTDFYMGAWPDAWPHVQAGNLKLITVIYPTRLSEVPDNQTILEQFPVWKEKNYPMGNWLGIVVPKGVPADIKAALSESMKAAVSTDTYKERVAALAGLVRYTTPEETDAFLRNEAAVWKKVAEAANIKLD